MKKQADVINGHALLQQVLERRVRKMCRKMQTAEKSAQYASLILRLSASATLFLVVGNLAGWFDAFLSSFKRDSLASGFIVVTFVIWCFKSLVPLIEVELIKKGLKKLRYQEWGYLSLVILNRPLRSAKLLSDPTVGFIIGHLFRQKGFDHEAKEIIDKAVRLSPSLGSVSLSEGKTLSAKDEKFLASELDQIVRNGLVYTIWRHPVARGLVIALGIASIVLFYAIQLMRIFHGLSN